MEQDKALIRDLKDDDTVLLTGKEFKNTLEDMAYLTILIEHPRESQEEQLSKLDDLMKNAQDSQIDAPVIKASVSQLLEKENQHG